MGSLPSSRVIKISQIVPWAQSGLVHYPWAAGPERHGCGLLRVPEQHHAAKLPAHPVNVRARGAG